MRLHVLVTPVADEPFLVTPGQVDAGQAWLEARVADDTFDMCLPFDRTGGFVLLTLDAPDRASARRRVAQMFADYPLLHTVYMESNVVLPTLKEGFDVLRAAVEQGRRVGS